MEWEETKNKVHKAKTEAGTELLTSNSSDRWNWYVGNGTRFDTGYASSLEVAKKDAERAAAIIDKIVSGRARRPAQRGTT